MRWTDRPTKRELILSLFSLAFFSLSYDCASLSTAPSAVHFLFGPTASHGRYNRVILHDGQSFPSDALDKIIFGTWNQSTFSSLKSGSRLERKKNGTVMMDEKYGAMWVEGREVAEAAAAVRGSVGTANDGFVRWEQDVPVSSLVWHVPGYSILDNVILFKGKVYIVSDDPVAFPPLSAIVTALGPGLNTWEIISLEEGRSILGSYGGMIRGVTWMSADTTPHNSTLLALWRTYSSLSSSPSNTATPSQLHTTPLPLPHRLIFPHTPVFTDPDPPKHFHLVRRRRADTGFHPFMLKAAFPSLTVLYQNDWEDFHKIGAPYVLERVVVADREAAAVEAHRRARVGEVPGWAGVFLENQQSNHNRHAGGLGEGWMEPVRESLVEYFGLGGQWAGKRTKKVVTYVHRQNANAGGLRLDYADHEALVRELKKLESDRALGGCEVHVVSSSSRPDRMTGWTDRMRAIVQSSVVLGVAHGDLLDAAFMKPSPHATLMEFFPDGRFFHDEEVVLRSRGVNYIAWWSDRKFTSGELPPVKELTLDHDRPEEVRIDVDRVVRAVLEVLLS